MINSLTINLYYNFTNYYFYTEGYNMIKLSCVVFLFFSSCSDNNQKLDELQSQITEIQKKVNDAYKPGLGEFMINIQLHHAKLWFAGLNENWKLAAFEIDEMKESFEDIQKYETEREETKMVPLIYPPLDSIRTAVDKRNISEFKESFTLLTNTCNVCHTENHFKFNKIKTPDTPPFSNQVFKKSGKKN